ncbi:non-SMC mitotic condensation complex subunit 1-domain-containing protein [Phycomyces blakesleeanus]|uniref:Condensin complex subunit 1 n=1 Tax=Phycomyces blakesleeanus TaxID=4837 RepID=A0ABR3AT59_PHYBL
MNGQFVLHEELLRLQQDAVTNYYIANEVVIHGRSDQELARYLNDITDRIEVAPDAIVDPLVYDKIRSFLKNFGTVNERILARLLDILLSAFRAEVKATSDGLENNEKETFQEHRRYLELYGFLVHWFLLAAEEKTTNVSTKSKKGKARTDDSGRFDWSTQKQKAFDIVGWMLELKLTKIWTMTPDRNTFISLFTKPAYQIFENPSNAKSNEIKKRVFKVLGMCIKNYNHAFAAQTSIMQNLQYWEHSAEPMAEFLHYLVEQQGYTQLVDEIIREISNKEFKETAAKELKDSPNAKTFAMFLQKLAELLPKTILKNIGVLIHQLDSESYTIRTAIIDILGDLIVNLSQQSEENTANVDQVNGFFDILEERMLDPIVFCRTKVLQTYLKLLDLRTKFPKRRHTLGILALRHLEDKSSSVRKYAIRVLTKLIATHPYSIYGGELDLEDWKQKLKKLKAEIANVESPDMALMEVAVSTVQTEESQPISTDAEDTEMPQAGETNDNAENATEVQVNVDVAVEQTQAETPAQAPKVFVSEEKMQQLILMKTFHTDAIRFIQQIHTAMPTILQLLSSKTKAEVLEAMDFLVVCYNYKVKPAADGIKRMLHLIWTKDTSDEGKGVKMKLLKSYRNIYLEMDANLTRRENINVIARNLIRLTFNTTLAELTSLEQLLTNLMAEDAVPDDVIERLWSVYGFVKGHIPKAQRRGAIIILGMLAKAKTEIVTEKVDLLLRIGLGPLGKDDLALSKYTCIALQRLAGTRTEKGRGVHEGVRFPMNHAIFARLRDVVESSNHSMEWFSVTEQAINTIYLLGEHPDILCAEMIRTKTISVFDDNQGTSDTQKPFEEEILGDLMDTDYDMSSTQPTATSTTGTGTTQSVHNPDQKSAFELSQLFFIVGHVALKQIVHLEIVEAAWKRKKTLKDVEEGKKHTSTEEELEQVNGTAEDDIGDAITHIREREILFGSNSLLARFGPMITEVCARNKIYTDRTLQITATLALAKFMCVSSDFCEKNLQLLFTILEKSKDPTIRSNIAIALGDMAVCFNTLIDENISFLYNRLGDEDGLVKKNAVMVLTHLILNGMVKVRGQISEMAKCLEDSDQRIADLAKLFFTELATKDNAIYNNLPDIISNLTNSEPKVEEETFHKIMKFIFSFEFTEKEKQAENVIDKLCQRFLNTNDKRVWRDIAFCLSLMPFKSDRSFRKLLEGIPAYQDKLQEEAVHRSFLEIVAKGRSQKVQKPELKVAVDELEQRIEKISGTTKEEFIKKAAKPKSVRPVKAEKEKGGQRQRSSVKRRFDDSDESEEELDLGTDDDDEDDDEDEDDEDDDDLMDLVDDEDDDNIDDIEDIDENEDDAKEEEEEEEDDDDDDDDDEKSKSKSNAKAKSKPKPKVNTRAKSKAKGKGKGKADDDDDDTDTENDIDNDDDDEEDYSE